MAAVRWGWGRQRCGEDACVLGVSESGADRSCLTGKMGTRRRSEGGVPGSVSHEQDDGAAISRCRRLCGKLFWRKERELVLDMFILRVPTGCPDRHG